MAAQHTVIPQVPRAKAPFYFNSATHLVRVEPERANSLGELLESLRRCSEASIFQHTYQTLAEHHFIRQGFSNDFAHWTFSACNEIGLAEQLAAIDVRNFTTIADLRTELVNMLGEYLDRVPRARDRAAAEPFYFCASELFLIPTPFAAADLAEFADCLRKVSVHSIQHHFIDARLRLQLSSNDFSQWLAVDADRADLAAKINRIDFYTQTLNGVRAKIVGIVETAL